MKKKEFINELKKKIKRLSKSEVDDIVSYYSELIDDRIENGEKEEDVILTLGSIDIIAKNILEEKNITQTEKSEEIEYEVIDKKKSNDTSSIKVVILILLLPLWLVLGIIAFSLIIAICSILFALFVTSISLLGAGLITFLGAFVQFTIDFNVGLVQLGISLILVSVGLLLGSIVPVLVTGSKKLINLIKKGVSK